MTNYLDLLSGVSPVTILGNIIEVSGGLLTARLNWAAPGDLVRVFPSYGNTPIEAEVLSCIAGRYILCPLEHFEDIRPGCKVCFVAEDSSVCLTPKLLGSVLNSKGSTLRHSRTISNQYNLRTEYRHCNAPPPLPLERSCVSEPFYTGIRAIDGLLTLGKGSRVVVLAEPGVGKTSLFGALLKNSEAAVNVVALIGERGREVKEFVERYMTSANAGNTVCIASTSDEPAALRIRAAAIAITIAEYFRDHGLDVMLQVDSLTRLVRAYRELGLAAGELPVRKGYPTSVFNLLPRFIERAGAKGKGSITAFYTALRTADFEEDPIVEEVISLTDGHISLSHDLARKGHYPAIDVLRSLSRLQHVAGDQSCKRASRVREAMSIISEQRESLLFGAKPSSALAAALEAESDIIAFLRQKSSIKSERHETARQLKHVVWKLEESKTVNVSPNTGDEPSAPYIGL